MAAYPAIIQDPSTLVVPQDTTTISVSDDGLVRGVNTSSEIAVEVSLFHLYVEDVDKQAVETFYSANYDATFTFTYNGDSSVYSVTFVIEPTYTWVNPGLWDIAVILVGVKQ